MPLLNGLPILDDRLAFGFQSDPQFLTTGPRTPNGVRLTNPLRTLPVMVFSFSFNNQFLHDVNAIRDMYYDVDGANSPFLMIDAIHWQIQNELIGTGDGVETQFQITRQLGVSNPKTKTLQHVDPGSLVVRVGGSVVTAFTETLGLLDFTAAPGNGDEIRIDAKYYYKVKFDNDRFPARRIAAPNPTGRIENLTATEQSN